MRKGESMKLGALFAPVVLAAPIALALVAGFATACSAAEKGKDGQPEYALPSAQFGDYSLKLDTTAPKPLDSPEPGALTDLRRDTIRPFVGFRLSRPISDDFWKIGR